MLITLAVTAASILIIFKAKTNKQVIKRVQI